jgi:hypothetical protein
MSIIFVGFRLETPSFRRWQRENGKFRPRSLAGIPDRFVLDRRHRDGGQLGNDKSAAISEYEKSERGVAWRFGGMAALDHPRHAASTPSTGRSASSGAFPLSRGE